jgi:multimeric flavodoxin WrbA
MKIIGLLSSPRKNGNTAGLLHEVLKGAKSIGAETEEIFLYEKNIEFCRGCMNCMQTGECVIKDDFKEIRDKIKNADGLVIGSPVYGFTFNALLRNLIERLGMFEYMTSSALGKKYVIGVSTAGGNIAKKVAKGLSYMSYGGIFKRGYSSGSIGVGVKSLDISKFPDSLNNAFLLGKKLVDDIKNKKKYVLQKLSERLVKNIILKPIMKKFIVQGKESNTKAIYNILIEEGVI